MLITNLFFDVFLLLLKFPPFHLTMKATTIFKIPSKAKTSFVLITATGVAALTLQPNPNSSAKLLDSKIRASIDGLGRSARALYSIASVVIDYQYSLRGLPPDSDEYWRTLSEVHLRSAKRILRLCEANKGFYVKAGQFVASLRNIPTEYSSTLSSLQDQAVPCPFEAIKEVLTRNLGKDLSEVFLSFDEQPIAAASIAQVHHALLKDYQEVAVKVQYPGLEQHMKIDITTMAILSNTVSRIFPEYRFDWMVSEFAKAISFELDFIQEGKNAERTAKSFKKNSVVKVPRVYWVDDLDTLKALGINPIKVAKALMEVFAEMIFVHGFVHGDPHPGNIFVSPVGRNGFSLVLLDHGIYKELDEQFRLDYCELWKALILLDSHKIQQSGERFGVGQYAKYFPVIFTGRTIDSKSTLAREMSTEEKRNLKQELNSLSIADINSFMESLPPDFLTILRTDGLLRSIISKLGAPRHVRLLAYAKYAAYGVSTKFDAEPGFTVNYIISRVRASMSYLQLRALIEIAELLSQMGAFGHSIATYLKRMVFDAVHFHNWSISALKT